MANRASKPPGSKSRATPASRPTTSLYRPIAEGNSIPSGSSSGPMAGPPPAPNSVVHPIETISPGSGTAGKQLGGGAKPAAVPADQSQYSDSDPGTSNSGDASTAETSTGSGGYGQY